MKNIAIISGASSKIGTEFVKQISIQKLDEIWIIGQNKFKMEELKKEVLTPLKIFDIDLTDQESFIKIEKELKNEKPIIKWLINAAQISRFGQAINVSVDDQTIMIDLNCKATAILTKLSIPYMEKFSKIINLSSVAAFQAVPFLSTYAATKSFVLNYSRALRYELKSKSISVTCVCPFWTKEKIIQSINQTKSDHLVKFCCTYNPRNIVIKGIKDSIKNKSVSLYGARAKIQHIISKILPTKVIIWLWSKQQKLEK